MEFVFLGVTFVMVFGSSNYEIYQFEVITLYKKNSLLFVNVKLTVLLDYVNQNVYCIAYQLSYLKFLLVKV